jgi:hypothetical protein
LEDQNREAVIKDRVIDALEKIRSSMAELHEIDEDFLIESDEKVGEVIIPRNETADLDYQDFEKIEMCSSLNESLAGDDLDEENPGRSKSKKSGKKSKNSKKFLNEAIKRNTTIAFDQLDSQATGAVSSPKDILDGMKRRIIFDEINITDTNKTVYTPVTNRQTTTGFFESMGDKSVNTPNEKGHFISMSHLKANSNKNIKFTNYATARINNEVEYNQLLECLCKLIRLFILNDFIVYAK